jgi:hypothetical protein
MFKGETPMIKFFITALCALAITFSGVARAAITENGELNVITGTATAPTHVSPPRQSSTICSWRRGWFMSVH